MRCKSCDYPLWNLLARACPECGAAFKPSEFDFNLNAVRFCCPHCSQSYYGTDARGHLVPPAFACVSCGNAITMDDCLLLPTGYAARVQDSAVIITTPDVDGDNVVPYLAIAVFPAFGQTLDEVAETIKAQNARPARNRHGDGNGPVFRIFAAVLLAG